jgi:hypothetical protein
MEKKDLSIYFDQSNNSISVLSDLLEMNLSSFYLKEILEIVNMVTPLLSKRPKIRPGAGKSLISGKYTFSEGTAEWWKYLGESIVEKIK